MSATTTLPIETDTRLADLYNREQALLSRIQSVGISLLQYAGAEFYYRGRRRVTDMTVPEAEAIVAERLAELEAHRAATTSDERPYGDWMSYVGKMPPHAQRGAESAVEKLAEARAELIYVREDMELPQAIYREHRWSRFFLVTSSQGHIHSSMHCSTCRPTTTYGWLPQLSGHTEEAAVAAHGPALCSVCFPSAPVEWTGGKLTKTQATKAAA